MASNQSLKCHGGHQLFWASFRKQAVGQKRKHPNNLFVSDPVWAEANLEELLGS